MSEHRQTPTHCVKGHPAQWCDCKRFVPAEPGAFTDTPMIRYPDSGAMRDRCENCDKPAVGYTLDDVGLCERHAPKEAGCGNCIRCLDGVLTDSGWPVTSTRMIVCPDCGNKRCPKASDHRLTCTGSNEPGQRGSVFGPVLRQPAPAASEDTLCVFCGSEVKDNPISLKLRAHLPCVSLATGMYPQPAPAASKVALSDYARGWRDAMSQSNVPERAAQDAPPSDADEGEWICSCGSYTNPFCAVHGEAFTQAEPEET